MVEKMKKRTIINVICLSLALSLIISSTLILKNFFDNNFLMTGYSIQLENLMIDSSKMNSNILSDMRFNHNNISYNIDENCTPEKISRIEYAFRILESQVGILSFYSIENQDADIDITCSDESFSTSGEEGDIITGRGGPEKYINSTVYPIIIKGRLVLYRVADCDYPIVELHEMLHVFGFGHSNESSDVLYPYLDCSQRISNLTVQSLKELYSVPARPELYFSNISLVRYNRYVNFSGSVINVGLEVAENTSITLTSGNDKLGNFELGNIGFGVISNIFVYNLKLPSSSPREINFTIFSYSSEYSNSNNVESIFV